MTTSRPAEKSSALVGALAALLAGPLGLDNPAEVAALAIVLGGLPGLVTWLVSRGWHQSG